MSNRVLWSPDGLKISAPGVNVQTATTTGLQFNSDWKCLKVLLKGGVFITYDNPFHTVYFGKTFAKPPLVTCGVSLDEDDYNTRRHTTFASFAGWSLHEWFTPTMTWRVRVYNDRLTIETAFIIGVRYVVWEYEE